MNSNTISLGNLRYCSDKVRLEVNKVFDSPGVHHFVKEIIQEGLDKDCLDAVKDVKLALEMLEKVYNSCIGQY